MLCECIYLCLLYQVFETFPSPINSEGIFVDPRMGEPDLEMDLENLDEESQILEQMSHGFTRYE